MFFFLLIFMSKSENSSDKEEEIDLNKGGKYLIRKMRIGNKEIQYIPQDKNNENYIEDGIIERFYKRENKKNNNNMGYPYYPYMPPQNFQVPNEQGQDYPYNQIPYGFPMMQMYPMNPNMMMDKNKK